MVFALTHREEWKHGYPRGYQTLWMGSKSHTIDRTYPWRDDNLSTGALTDENFLYSEYSGLYFLWKYLQNEDPQTIIVIDHYDWFFSKKRIFRFMLNEKDIRALVRKHPLYFPVPTDIAKNFGGMNVYELNKTALLQNIDLIAPAVQKLYPDAAEALQRVYTSHEMCSGNMMICRKPFFDEYMSFFFSLVNEMKDHVDLSGLKDRRVFGFMGEILINVFAIYKGIEPAPLAASSCLPIHEQIVFKIKELRAKKK